MAEVVASGTDQTGIGTTIIDVTGATVTFNAIQNRRYRFSAGVNIGSGVAATTMMVFLCDGSNNLHRRMAQLQAVATSGSQAAEGVWTWLCGTTGSITFKLRAQAGANTFTVYRGLTEYAPHLLVEDIGPGGNPV